MCDTLVALGNSTADGSVIFAKNSDREPNEASHLLLVPASDHLPGSSVQCTYISIPQVAHTNQVLLAKPFWIWGAEMGANEHGVVIGNEAVFTRLPYEKAPGLIGMDFLRLALERGSSAFEALQVITALLEQYGQSGNCGLSHGFYYHNSYLIADAREAWVLETAGRQWAAEKVKDIRTISNAITIGSTWDLASDGLVDTALEKGWCRKREDFNFASCYSDTIYTTFSDARKRQCTTTEGLRAARGTITAQTAMQILRGHHPGAEDRYKPDHGFTGAEVCMHAGYGPVRNSQSAGSMVSQLFPGQQCHWLTGTSAPCTGIFKPVWMDAGLPDTGPAPTAQFTPESLWWRHELLHREVLRDYQARLSAYREDRDALESEFFQRAQALHSASGDERIEFSAGCFRDAESARQQWHARIKDMPLSRRLSFSYALAWKGFNRQAKMSG